MSAGMPFREEFGPRGRRYLNSDASLVVCREASALFTRLAVETEGFDATLPLSSAMEEAAYVALKLIFVGQGTGGVEEKKSIAEEYFRLAGLGRLSLTAVGLAGGAAQMSRSSVDEAWIEKWGTSRAPVNHIGRGYIAGAFAAITGQGIGSFAVRETASIAMGDPASEFSVLAAE
jgi:predicted hydrocarbon binding protein